MNLPNSLTVTRIFLVPLLVVALLTKVKGHLILGVPKEVVAQLDPRLQELLGYSVLGLLGNVDGRNPKKYIVMLASITTSDNRCTKSSAPAVPAHKASKETTTPIEPNQTAGAIRTAENTLRWCQST